MAGLTPKELDDRDKLFDDYISKKKMKGPIAQTAAVKKAMDFDRWFGNIPTPQSLTSDFMAEWRNNFKVEPDIDKSMEQTAKTLARNYKITDVNGYEEVMYLPPDNPIFARNMLFAKFSEESAKQKELYDKGEVDSYYEINPSIQLVLPHESLIRTEKLLFKGIATQSKDMLGISPATELAGYQNIGKQIEEAREFLVTKVTRGGEPDTQTRVEGNILIKPDENTAYPVDGKTKSYPVLFLAKDKIQPRPVYQTEDYSNWRFEINDKDIATIQISERTAEEKEADRLRKQAKIIEERFIATYGVEE
jgi:hypothetical protein